MWILREDGVRTAGGAVHLVFTEADPAGVQRRAAEMGAEGVRQRVLDAAAGSPAVRRLAALQREYADATASADVAAGTLSRLGAERAAAVDACGPGLAGRLVELDRRAAETRAGAGQGVGTLEPLLKAAYWQALAEVRAAQRGETARAGAAAGRARAEAIAGLAALPEVQELLTTIAAAVLASFAASGGALLGGDPQALLAQALQQATAAAAEGTGEPEAAEAEARPGIPVAVG